MTDDPASTGATMSDTQDTQPEWPRNAFDEARGPLSDRPTSSTVLGFQVPMRPDGNPRTLSG